MSHKNVILSDIYVMKTNILSDISYMPYATMPHKTNRFLWHSGIWHLTYKLYDMFHMSIETNMLSETC